MTTPTKQVAMGFSASAFLTPKNLSADKLFEWVDNDDLKKLKPSAEQVRDAILLCKQHGINARFTGGLALSISGDFEALHTCFGVRLMIDSDPNAKERKWFEDDAGAKQGLVKPVANHPLGKHIVNIVLEPSIEPTIHQQPQPQPQPQPPPPRFPGTNIPWGKQQPYHIWPHELRDRMGWIQKPESPEPDPFDFFEKKFFVILLDSGLNGSHPYFQGAWGNKLKITSQGPNTQIHWPEVSYLETVGQNLANQVLSAKDTFIKLQKVIKELPELLKVGQNIYFDQNSKYVKRKWRNSDSPKQKTLSQQKIENDLGTIFDSRFYKIYESSSQLNSHAKSLVKLIEDIAIVDSERLWKGASSNDYDHFIQEVFDSFGNFVEKYKDKLYSFMEWLDVKFYGKKIMIMTVMALGWQRQSSV